MVNWRKPRALLIEYLDRLSERDRRVLLVGAPLILVLVLYILLVQPLVGRYQLAASKNSQLREDLIWLAAQRDHLERVNSFCQIIDPVARDQFESLIVNQARRFGMNASVRSGFRPGDFAVILSGVSGNSVLALTKELSCRGLELNKLILTQAGVGADRVEATLELHPL